MRVPIASGSPAAFILRSLRGIGRTRPIGAGTAETTSSCMTTPITTAGIWFTTFTPARTSTRSIWARSPTTQRCEGCGARARLNLGRVQRDDGVAALLAGLFNRKFGAVDQISDDVFAVEVRPSYCFDHSRAKRNLGRVPWWAQTARGSAQL